MVLYLIKLLYLLIFSSIVIFFYYLKFTFHQENFDGYTPYVLSILFFYFLYKSIQYVLQKEYVTFTPLKIFLYFLLQLFVLSVLFFSLNSKPGALGFTLFFKIVGFLFIPMLIISSSISFGRFLLSKIKAFSDQTSIFQFLFSLGIGFFSFLTLLTIFGFVSLYNLYSVFFIIIAMILISHKEFLDLLKSIFTYKIQVKSGLSDGNAISRINLYLLSTEFLFVVISFLISVNLINIVRPMPIGWDDLGVYMNYPNLMANSGKILDLGMIPWQTFTGIGYMFGSATQSFFLNNVGGILSVLVIILSFTDLLRSKAKTFINIPFLAGAIFLAMPMVIFQQAKDMKLDTGLFFVSAIVVYLTIYIFTRYLGFSEDEKIGNLRITKETEKNLKSLVVSYKDRFISYFSRYTHIGEKDIFSDKSYLMFLFLIGVLAGFAFSIKVTSLLLISGILAVVFYSKLGIAGLFSYISVYLGIFTKFGLWDMMFVLYPKDDLEFRNKFFIYSFLAGLLLLSYSIYKYGFKSFKNLVVLALLFLIGVGVGFSPWWIKNLASLKGEYTIHGLLSGRPEGFKVDYTKIYTQKEIDEINKKNDASLTVSESGTTKNEDLGRYFGYEKGINNYIKLPYNLTMQVNQRGEFTDITYIYLALIPVVATFLAFKHKLLSIGVFGISFFMLLFFFHSFFNHKLTKIFSNFNLPFGYLILALFFLVPFIYLMYGLNREKNSTIFKLNLVFAFFYVFLWTISAFGIVWYGIAMYYSLLLIIAIGAFYVSSYREDDDLKVYITKFFGSTLVLLVVFIYFFNSTFPHGFINLKTSGYDSYKAGIANNYTSIFDSHGNYYEVLVELNISPEKRNELFKYIFSKIKSEKLKSILAQNGVDNLIKLNLILKEINSLKDETGKNLELIAIKKEVNRIRSELYKNVLYPKKDFKNNAGIYRIGTFLRYFISDNHKRLFEDNMIIEFDKFFYDEKNLDLTIDRMKKIGVSYFLVDLNAATIDRDPRHDLTKRYERLLRTFTSNNLELYETDSICLKIALEDYNKSKKEEKDFKKYMALAGVNYESYTETGEVIYRGLKQAQCYNYILSLIKDKKIDKDNYSYLMPIAHYLEKAQIKSQEELSNFFRNYVSHGWMALFRIK